MSIDVSSPVGGDAMELIQMVRSLESASRLPVSIGNAMEKSANVVSSTSLHGSAQASAIRDKRIAADFAQKAKAAQRKRRVRELQATYFAGLPQGKPSRSDALPAFSRGVITAFGSARERVRRESGEGSHSSLQVTEGETDLPLDRERVGTSFVPGRSKFGPQNCFLAMRKREIKRMSRLITDESIQEEDEQAMMHAKGGPKRSGSYRLIRLSTHPQQEEEDSHSLFDSSPLPSCSGVPTQERKQESSSSSSSSGAPREKKAEEMQKPSASNPVDKAKKQKERERADSTQFPVLLKKIPTKHEDHQTETALYHRQQSHLSPQKMGETGWRFRLRPEGDTSTQGQEEAADLNANIQGRGRPVEKAAGGSRGSIRRDPPVTGDSRQRQQTEKEGETESPGRERADQHGSRRHLSHSHAMHPPPQPIQKKPVRLSTPLDPPRQSSNLLASSLPNNSVPLSTLSGRQSRQEGGNSRGRKSPLPLSHQHHHMKLPGHPLAPLPPHSTVPRTPSHAFVRSLTLFPEGLRLLENPDVPLSSSQPEEQVGNNENAHKEQVRDVSLTSSSLCLPFCIDFIRPPSTGGQRRLPRSRAMSRAGARTPILSPLNHPCPLPPGRSTLPSSSLPSDPTDPSDYFATVLHISSSSSKLKGGGEREGGGGDAREDKSNLATGVKADSTNPSPRSRPPKEAERERDRSATLKGPQRATAPTGVVEVVRAEDKLTHSEPPHPNLSSSSSSSTDTAGDQMASVARQLQASTQRLEASLQRQTEAVALPSQAPVSVIASLSTQRPAEETEKKDKRRTSHGTSKQLAPLPPPSKFLPRHSRARRSTAAAKSKLQVPTHAAARAGAPGKIRERENPKEKEKETTRRHSDPSPSTQGPPSSSSSESRGAVETEKKKEQSFSSSSSPSRKTEEKSIPNTTARSRKQSLSASAPDTHPTPQDVQPASSSTTSVPPSLSQSQSKRDHSQSLHAASARPQLTDTPNFGFSSSASSSQKKREEQKDLQQQPPYSDAGAPSPPSPMALLADELRKSREHRIAQDEAQKEKEKRQEQEKQDREKAEQKQKGGGRSPPISPARKQQQQRESEKEGKAAAEQKTMSTTKGESPRGRLKTIQERPPWRRTGSLDSQSPRRNSDAGSPSVSPNTSRKPSPHRRRSDPMRKGWKSSAPASPVRPASSMPLDVSPPRKSHSSSQEEDTTDPNKREGAPKTLTESASVSSLLSLSAVQPRGSELNVPTCPYVPVSESGMQRLIVAADLKKSDFLLDIGCGNGRLLAVAAQSVPGIRGMGVEIRRYLALEAARRLEGGANKSKRVREECRNISIVHGDIMRVDCSLATVVVAYLTQDLLAAVARKLEREMAPGCRIISILFSIPGWKTSKLKETPSGVYRYVLGEHRGTLPGEEKENLKGQHKQKEKASLQGNRKNSQTEETQQKSQPTREPWKN
uniref:Methyltransferase domain-containing protein n=1 Tax=Chromera velia CCMP2878 TaxID=1169474 RepID=A0A0G4FZN3_9ALVE|eukprot:Cvel_3969.t1-p1 / transcript=Cvel_3969.t1 / gene=Cvel_3969 / organism=Chromera_velia_CCMP2878 / gene_product=hypothetical protein / transcript_product=hypothetical protein / location=Cvel_scaffold168:76916-81616(+) / protein_length=1436 / sequence_SO=supercontig / SO=protein_coding / is_pseudo=false